MRKIYLFNNTQKPGWGECYSITDDGIILGSHICSDSSFMLDDLYLRKDRKDKVDEYFKDEPYEVVIIPDQEVSIHQGLKEAYKLNQEIGDKATQYEKAGVELVIEKGGKNDYFGKANNETY